MKDVSFYSTRSQSSGGGEVYRQTLRRQYGTIHDSDPSKSNGSMEPWPLTELGQSGRTH